MVLDRSRELARSGTHSRTPRANPRDYGSAGRTDRVAGLPRTIAQDRAWPQTSSEGFVRRVATGRARRSRRDTTRGTGFRIDSACVAEMGIGGATRVSSADAGQSERIGSRWARAARRMVAQRPELRHGVRLGNPRTDHREHEPCRSMSRARFEPGAAIRMAGRQGASRAPCPTFARYWIWMGEPAPPPSGRVIWFGLVGGCTPIATSRVRASGAAEPSGSSVRYCL